MFENQKFLTRGVMAEIPSWLTNLMWHMVLTMEVEEKDYLQVILFLDFHRQDHVPHKMNKPCGNLAFYPARQEFLIFEHL